MRQTIRLPGLLLALLLLLPLAAVPGAAQGDPAGPPGAAERAGGSTEASGLFASDEPLEMVIRADFGALKGDRDQEEEYREGSVTIIAPGSEPLELYLGVKTRGRFRLKRDTCRFPPLRLNFKKGELEGTFLDGEDKLKLVTHCRDLDDYEQNVLEEYLVYRMFNQLTDRSFRVRLARITYEDTGGDDPLTRWGFLIEDEDRMAGRLGGELLEEEELHPARMVGRNTGIVALFQFMVGNTDFSLYQNHNVKVVATGSELIPVPYDFDWTGFVDAPYARPDPRLPIQSVEQRLFRGLCRPDVDYEGLYRLFRERRGAMEELIRTQVGLEKREDALEYVEEFYAVIDDEKKARRDIEEKCRGG